MYRKIILQVMHDLIDDTTYVRIATATSFIHALIFNVIVLYYLIMYSDILTSNTILGDLLQDYIDMFSFDASMIWRLIVISIFLLIGYELLPPIGDAAQIYYLDQPERKDGFRAFAQGLYKFFPMFEFNVATGFFKMSFILLILVRLWLFDLIWNPLIIIVMSLRLIISFFVHLFLPYSRVIICLDDKPFFEAMKESMYISVHNMTITLKFVMINFILSIRFFVNLLIVIGIPVVIIYLWARLGLDNIVFMKYLFLIVLILLVFLVAYIEGIIEWFFSAARRRIYKIIKDEPLPDQGKTNTSQISSTSSATNLT